MRDKLLKSDVYVIILSCILCAVSVNVLTAALAFMIFYTIAVLHKKKWQLNLALGVLLGAALILAFVFPLVILGDLGRKATAFIQLITFDGAIGAIFSYWFMISVLDIVVPFALVPTMLFVSFASNNEIERLDERINDKHKRFDKDGFWKWVRDNILFVGTTRSGKTANALRMVEDAFENDEDFIMAMDGKGSKKKYSIYNVVRKLAKKYGRKLYILDQGGTNKFAYNPFTHANATQIVNMLNSMSEWESPYYENMVKRYWLFMLKILKLKQAHDAEFSFSFKDIIYYSNPQRLLVLLNQMGFPNEIGIKIQAIKGTLEHVINEYHITEGEAKSLFNTAFDILNNKNMMNAVDDATARFALFAEGDGAELFSATYEFSMQQAINERAVVIVLLNEFSYGTYAGSVGHLVIEDLKVCLGRILDNVTELYGTILWDEMSVYFDEKIVQIINKSAELGIRNLLCTQSFADLEALDATSTGNVLRRQLIENCSTYVFMRQNDDTDSEQASNLMGTISKIKATQQSTNDGNGYSTGRGTKTVDEAYKVSPNIIRDLPKNVGFFYTKDEDKPRPKKFKTQFVDVSMIDDDFEMAA